MNSKNNDMAEGRKVVSVSLNAAEYKAFMHYKALTTCSNALPVSDSHALKGALYTAIAAISKDKNGKVTKGE